VRVLHCLAQGIVVHRIVAKHPLELLHAPLQPADLGAGGDLIIGSDGLLTDRLWPGVST
jgi:hypothetical protein